MSENPFHQSSLPVRLASAVIVGFVVLFAVWLFILSVRSMGL